jgi:transglutaminase-like putative cysteine protease
MKHFRSYLSLTLVLISFSICSQNYELGKVTVQELEEKEHPVEKDAAAAVLFTVGSTNFEYSGDDGFRIVTEIITKIKIYKKEGYDFANHSEKYFVGGNSKEKVMFTKAVTYNLVNGKIEKTKLGSEGEFSEDLNKFWSVKKISMPNVREGSIIEYRVVITSPFISNFPEWEFQKEIPVNYSEYSTFIPEYFIYNKHYKGFLTPATTTTSKERTIEYSYTEDMPERGVAIAERVKTSVAFKEEKTKYTLANIKALKEEAFVNNINNYRISILHEISGTRYPGSPYKNLSTDWESVTQTIYREDDFGGELKKTGYFEKDLDLVLNNSTSKIDKMYSILNFVKSKMNWNNYYGINCSDGVRTAYKNNKGNVAEINLMLTAMLRYAGLTANPVLLSTRENGISIFPNRTSFNYVIAAVEIEEGVVLLDATEKIATPNILPIRVLNWEGRLIRIDGSSTSVSLVPSILSKDTKQIMAKLDSEGKITGKIRIQNTDYNAYNFRSNYLQVSKDSYIERLEKSYNNTQIDEYNVTNDKDLAKPVIEDIAFTSNNLVEIIGSKIYFSPMLFFQLSENPFKLEKREYPVDFVYPQQDKYTFSITIPEGYQVESVPAPLAIAIDNNMVVYKYNIQTVGNSIQLTTTLDVNQSIVPPHYYEGLKEFFKNVVEKQIEKVVLVKI